MSRRCAPHGPAGNNLRHGRVAPRVADHDDRPSHEPASLAELVARAMREHEQERVARDLGAGTYRALRNWLARRDARR